MASASISRLSPNMLILLARHTFQTVGLTIDKSDGLLMAYISANVSWHLAGMH